MNDGQCFICKSWMDENQLVKGDDGFVRCYEHAYLNQETLITALREAGEKMAKIYTHLPKEIRNESNVYYQILLSGVEAVELMTAFEAWEAANK